MELISASVLFHIKKELLTKERHFGTAYATEEYSNMLFKTEDMIEIIDEAVNNGSQIRSIHTTDKENEAQVNFVTRTGYKKHMLIPHIWRTRIKDIEAAFTIVEAGDIKNHEKFQKYL